MNNTLDRQGILDNLTAIESTAKLLVNAFVKKNHDTELSLHGIHREELISQTTIFLSKAQQLIVNLSNTFNLTTDGSADKKLIETNGRSNSTSVLCDASENHEHKDVDIKSSPSKNIYSVSTVTFDDIIQNRLTPKHLLPNYPLFHDPIQPNLVALARNLRQIENVDDLILKTYSKIFNHEERICCNYAGINGKLLYPRHKRLLFNLLIKLTLNEHEKTIDENTRQHFYTECEQHFCTETTATKYRGLPIDHLNDKDEKQFICSLFRLVVPQDDIKRIISAKQDVSSQWNDNEMCINYARPIHLLWIKQKWLEKYPSNSNDESQKWSQCIDWAIDSFLGTKKIRPSKRKTMDAPTDHKRTKTGLTLQEKFKQIDRTKFDVFEYATQLLHLISEDNNQTLPTCEQLQLLEHHIIRFYWTSDQQLTWSRILDMISSIFVNKSKDDFRQFYSSKLLNMNPSDSIEIERLLQITL